MRFRLRSKLFVGVLVYLLLLGAVGLIGLYAAQASLEGMHTAVDHHVHELSVVGELASDMSLVKSTLLLHAMTNAPDEQQTYERQVYLIEARIDALIDDLARTEARYHDRAELEQVDAFRGAWYAFVQVQEEQFLPTSRDLPDENAYELARDDGALGQALDRAQDGLTALQIQLPQESTRHLQRAEGDFERNRDLLELALLLAGLFGIWLGLSQATRLAQAIEALSRAARRVAEGSLGEPVVLDTGDELESLADSFNSMTSSLAEMTERQNEQVRALEAENAERRRIESALRESETRFRTVTESVNEAIVSVDAAGKILFWNRGAETIFGYTADEMFGQRWAFLLPSRYRAEYGAGLVRSTHEAPSEAAGRKLELFGLRKDGSEVPLELSVSQWTSGGAQFATAIIADVTERRAVERIKNEFVSMVSHELRTPLNGILGMADLLVRGNIGPQEREYVEAAQRSGESLLAIIDDILDLSKIEAGRLELDIGPLDVRQVAEDVAALLARPAQRKGLELVCAVDPAVPRSVMGDASRLRQVLLNLVGNAVKFTDAGEVMVRVGLAECGSDHSLLRFEVVDTGVGISHAARKRLFQPFSQGDTSPTRRHGGTGLGLAISKRLAELMGGEIGLESAPGRGSTFWFTASFAHPAPPMLIEAPAAPAHGLAGRRVLVVDDNATSRRVFEQQLAACQAATQAVADANSALERLQTGVATGQPFALALIDRHLPTPDGLTLARQIAADPALRDTRVVLLTALGETASDPELDWLEKPVRWTRLASTLGQLLGGSHPTREAADRPPVAAPAASRTNPASAGRVLVVDDTPTSRQIAAGLLRGLGCAVDVASNGREALEAIQAAPAPYAAVLMDCQMPVMDGYAATAEIRRREGTRRRTPIIAMTANAMRGDRERCLAAGMDDYIAKPLRFERLSAIVGPYLHADQAPVDADEDDRAPVEAPGEGPAGSAIEWPAVLKLAQDLARFDGAGSPGATLAAMVAQFREEGETRLAALRDAVLNADPSALRQAAHSLRGTASTLGARQVVDLCARLERLGREGSLRDADTLVETLEAAVIGASSALEGSQLGAVG